MYQINDALRGYPVPFDRKNAKILDTPILYTDVPVPSDLKHPVTLQYVLTEHDIAERIPKQVLTTFQNFTWLLYGPVVIGSTGDKLKKDSPCFSDLIGIYLPKDVEPEHRPIFKALKGLLNFYFDGQWGKDYILLDEESFVKYYPNEESLDNSLIYYTQRSCVKAMLTVTYDTGEKKQSDVIVPVPLVFDRLVNGKIYWSILYNEFVDIFDVITFDQIELTYEELKSVAYSGDASLNTLALKSTDEEIATCKNVIEEKYRNNPLNISKFDEIKDVFKYMNNVIATPDN